MKAIAQGTRAANRQRVNQRSRRVEVRAFLSSIDRVLISKLARLRGSAGEIVTAAPLGRVGYSGARLLLCYVGDSMPYVVKIDTETHMLSEAQRAKAVSDHFNDAKGLEGPVFQQFRVAAADDSPVPIEQLEPQSKEPARSVSLGAILYPHMGGLTSLQIKQARELRELVFRRTKSRRKSDDFFTYSDARISELFEKLYHRFAAARDACKTRRKFVVCKEYAAYLRKRGESEEVIRALLGSSGENETTLDFLGARILNPLRFCNAISRLRITGSFSPIHGDLHANNVIVSPYDEVHLIDFAWAAKSAHALKDYALMEVSLRFLLFPHHVHLGEQLKVDQLLLEPDGAKELAEFNAESHLAPYYRRLGCILSIVRSEAFRHAPTLDGGAHFHEYLLSQFLILYGNMKYDEYNRYSALRALGLIAMRLQDLLGVSGEPRQLDYPDLQSMGEGRFGGA